MTKICPIFEVPLRRPITLCGAQIRFLTVTQVKCIATRCQTVRQFRSESISLRFFALRAALWCCASGSVVCPQGASDSECLLKETSVTCHPGIGYAIMKFFKPSLQVQQQNAQESHEVPSTNQFMVYLLLQVSLTTD